MRLELDKTYEIDVRFSQRRGIATSRSKDEEDDDDEQLHPFHLLHPSTFDRLQRTVRRLAVLFRSAGDSEGRWGRVEPAEAEAQSVAVTLLLPTEKCWSAGVV